MSLETKTSIPAVASLWVGDALNWLHEISLASFVQRGHEVVLFCVGEPPAVPAGIRTAPIQDIWDPQRDGHEKAPASMLSDLFRLHLLQKTDMIWVDTDMLCYRSLPDMPYHVGYEPPGTVNGAVLRLPKDSRALLQLQEWFADPEWVPPWLNDRQKEEVLAEQPGRRLLKSFRVQRPSLGPRALQNTLKITGEDKNIAFADVFYPVRGVMTDILFSGYCRDDLWLTESTLAIHLYASMVRRYHQTHRPEPQSFMDRFAKEIGFDLSGLKLQIKGTS